MSPAEIRAALASGLAVSDAAFDALYPEELRGKSELNWTAVAIALRAAQLLDALPGVRVLDVGCGAGKACLVAQLATGVRWWGVERDPLLVEAAHHAAWLLGIRDDVRFIAGEVWDVDWDEFDAFYFFNPFPLPPEAPGNAFQRYGAFVGECAKAEARLVQLRAGTRVVTYHGFGGDMPECYELIAHERAGTDALRLYRRR